MKKTIGMIALTAGLVAAGCSMLPNTAKVSMTEGGASGPVTLNFGRSIQAIASNLGASTVEITVYKADAATDLYSPGMTIAKDPLTGANIATTSAVTANQASVTLPAIPDGRHIIVLNVKKANGDIVAQSEAFVNALRGVPLTATLPLYVTYLPNQNLTTYSNSATASAYLSGLTAGTNGLALRMTNWSPSMQLAGSGSAGVRVSIVNTAAYAASVSTASVGTKSYWAVGNIGSADGFSATQSFTWTMSSDKKVLYADVDFTTAGTIANLVGQNTSSAASGSFSFVLPAAALPTGYKVYVTDNASGSSLPGTGGV